MTHCWSLTSSTCSFLSSRVVVLAESFPRRAPKTPGLPATALAASPLPFFALPLALVLLCCASLSHSHPLRFVASDRSAASLSSVILPRGSRPAARRSASR